METALWRTPQLWNYCIDSCTLKRIARSALALILLAAAASPCGAVIILEKGKDQEIRGYLVRENDVRVIVNQILPDGRLKQLVLPRSAIDVMIKTVKPERLAELKPDNPRAYRDYAEELSPKRKDPDAQLTAIRLYLISAHLSPTELGRGSLLGMAGLARSPAEERAFRAMAYLLDPDHDQAVLTDPVATVPARAKALDARQQQLLLKGLRALRGGRKSEAQTRGNVPQFQQLLRDYEGYLSPEEFSAAARDRDSSLSPSLLKRILTLELVLLNVEAPDRTSTQRTSPWSQIPTKQLQLPVPALNLETLTEFNPRECVFQGGKWVEP